MREKRMKTLESLATEAWIARESAFLIGSTKVGAALVTDNEHVFTGCNIEHRYRIRDVHAEVAAITCMVVNGHKRIRAIIIVAERDKFTPCGSCLDWVFQFGGPDCIVGFQGKPQGPIEAHQAKDLMPFYPQ